MSKIIIELDAFPKPNVTNANGHFWSQDAYDKAQEQIKELIDNKRFLGELDHDGSSDFFATDLHDVVGVINNYNDKAEIEILDRKFDENIPGDKILKAAYDMLLKYPERFAIGLKTIGTIVDGSVNVDKIVGASITLKDKYIKKID